MSLVLVAVAANSSNVMVKSKLIKSTLWVVVGFIFQPDGSILIARRPEKVDQGGLWEFPGGKRESGETALAALARELSEEVGIQLSSAVPCLQYTHRYDKYDVFFDCWRVTEYTGVPSGCEGQPIRWASIDDLDQYDFPAGNQQMLGYFQKESHCESRSDEAISVRL